MREHQIFTERQKCISLGELEHGGSAAAPTLGTKRDGPPRLLLAGAGANHSCESRGGQGGGSPGVSRDDH
ncbi:hypothetical protein EYF80_067892 [Liparis tanakae]|uniref:Uncharacterized protein n=1 Tax=Liparis tanakae TaxID=230148 RepID=A0A4Z2DZP8_9TELE|nr:hypothetical protein EYF80_067892 [Liparis tanakae]